jgi:hypothetical protein
MAIVYQHIRLDTNEIFYVGIATKKARAFQKGIRRNKIWNNIVNKTDYKVEILAEDLTWDEACILEIEKIKNIGRIDLQSGSLSNLTDGGDGSLNRSSPRKGLKGFIGYNKGVIRTEEYKRKMSIAKIGKSLGKLNGRAKMVLDLQTGIFYDYLKEGCKAVNLNYQTENNRINNYKKKFRFIYI